MILRCVKCGRQLAEIDLPKFQSGQVSTVSRVMKMFGGGPDSGELDQLLNPTAEGLAETFNVRCSDALAECEALAAQRRRQLTGVSVKSLRANADCA